MNCRVATHFIARLQCLNFHYSLDSPLDFNQNLDSNLLSLISTNGFVMKVLITSLGLIFSLNTFASERILTCTLSENDQVLRGASVLLNHKGDAKLDLGQEDVHNFYGFAVRGNPGVMILSPEKGPEASGVSLSAESSRGTILTITCDVVEE